MIQIVENCCNNGHVRIHTRMVKNTTLHHPSMNSDNDTDPKHNKTCQFRARMDQYRNCLWMRSVDCWSTEVNLSCKGDTSTPHKKVPSHASAFPTYLTHAGDRTCPFSSAEGLTDFKSTSGRVLCIFGSQTFCA